MLAAGDVVAFYLDAWGKRHEMAKQDWWLPEAREAMQRGVAFTRRHSSTFGREVEETWELFVDAADSPPASMEAKEILTASDGHSGDGRSDICENVRAAEPRGHKSKAAHKAFTELFGGVDPGRERMSDRELHERLIARHREAGRSNDHLWDLHTSKRVSGRRTG